MKITEMEPKKEEIKVGSIIKEIIGGEIAYSLICENIDHKYCSVNLTDNVVYTDLYDSIDELIKKDFSFGEIEVINNNRIELIIK